ncbi:MAG: XylR N-terminal domain-containing protein [Deltaproteobacteria bacterium]|nr:XylR N-terminal domain-containing protein [Candidatus Zymogenaceae bacterium]
MTSLKAVGVPPDLVPAFEAAEERIKGFFDTVKPYPEKGRIEIGGTRFMWAQARGMALAFRDTISEIYGEKGAEQILYKFGNSLGAQEARAFIERFKSKDPVERLAAGPVYFAYTGWAFVELLPSSRPSLDENCIFTFNHFESFEAEVFIADKKKADHPMCFINAGYSSGWTAESFGLPLESREVTCQAQGDEHCTFILTHRSKMLERLDKFRELLKTKKRSEITTEDLL